MEKRKAHYSLSEVKALSRNGHVLATKSALVGASALGYSIDDMKYVIDNLEPEDLHKSMTSNHDKTLWQDVYRYPAAEGDIYIKIQIIDSVVIISFKEL